MVVVWGRGAVARVGKFLRRHDVNVLLAGVVAFVLGAVAGRLLAGHLSLAAWLAAAGIWARLATSMATTSAWASAIGTWVGAMATIGTIIWAVHVFQRQGAERAEAQVAAEVEQRLEAAERENAALTIAKGVTGRCFGGGGNGGQMSSIHVQFSNASDKNAALIKFALQDVKIAAASVAKLPTTIAAGMQTDRITLDTVPFSANANEFSGRLLNSRTPTITYSLDGMLWVRDGEDNPPPHGRGLGQIRDPN